VHYTPTSNRVNPDRRTNRPPGTPADETRHTVEIPVPATAAELLTRLRDLPAHAELTGIVLGGMIGVYEITDLVDAKLTFRSAVQR
jgi:hypothetical protein